MRPAVFTPPEELYKSPLPVQKDECISFGINMYFQQAPKFIDDPN